MEKEKCICNKRVFEYYPEHDNLFWSYNGENKGKASDMVIYGCMECGKVWCKNYGE